MASLKELYSGKHRMKIELCDKYEKLYNFVHLISTDYVELSHEKVRVQRDEYMRRARKLIQELDNECNI
jgi:hypothetical protein